MHEQNTDAAGETVEVEVDMDKRLLIDLADELRSRDEGISEYLSECGRRRLEQKH